jgi:hypothetical protein
MKNANLILFTLHIIHPLTFQTPGTTFVVLINLMVKVTLGSSYAAEQTDKIGTTKVQ